MSRAHLYINGRRFGDAHKGEALTTLPRKPRRTMGALAIGLQAFLCSAVFWVPATVILLWWLANQGRHMR